MWQISYPLANGASQGNYFHPKNRQILGHHIRGYVDFFISVKFATSLLASLTGGKVLSTHLSLSIYKVNVCMYDLNVCSQCIPEPLEGAPVCPRPGFRLPRSLKFRAPGVPPLLCGRGDYNYSRVYCQ